MEMLLYTHLLITTSMYWHPLEDAGNRPVMSQDSFSKGWLVLIIPSGALGAGCGDYTSSYGDNNWANYECPVHILANKTVSLYFWWFWKYLGGLLDYAAAATQRPSYCWEWPIVSLFPGLKSDEIAGRAIPCEWKLYVASVACSMGVVHFSALIAGDNFESFPYSSCSKFMLLPHSWITAIAGTVGGLLDRASAVLWVCIQTKNWIIAKTTSTPPMPFTPFSDVKGLWSMINLNKNP